MDTYAKQASVPVCTMLDHAYSESIIEKSIEFGIKSVMYDISTCPLKEHIIKMKKMVDYCKGKSVQVEGELGYLGREQSSWDASAEQEQKSNYKHGSEMTSPEQTIEYVSQTGVKGLAVSID
jgi:fructose-bisphosphate aldolase class II